MKTSEREVRRKRAEETLADLDAIRRACSKGEMQYRRYVQQVPELAADVLELLAEVERLQKLLQAAIETLEHTGVHRDPPIHAIQALKDGLNK